MGDSNRDVEALTKVVEAVARFSDQKGYTCSLGDGNFLEIKDQRGQLYSCDLKPGSRLTFSGRKPTVEVWYIAMFEADRLMVIDPDNDKSISKFIHRVEKSIEAEIADRKLKDNYKPKPAGLTAPR